MFADYKLEETVANIIENSTEDEIEDDSTSAIGINHNLLL